MWDYESCQADIVSLTQGTLFPYNWMTNDCPLQGFHPMARMSPPT